MKLLRWLCACREAKVRVQVRKNFPVARQHDADTLMELLWQQNVQRNIERRRALKLIGE